MTGRFLWKKGSKMQLKVETEVALVEQIREMTKALQAASDRLVTLSEALAARPATPVAPAPEAVARVNTWNDPFSESRATENPAFATPFEVELSSYSNPLMKVAISETGPAAAPYPPGTDGFRYWVAAEAIARGIAFWSPLLPEGTTWSAANPMPVYLNADQALNALYRRGDGLLFYSSTVKGIDIYAVESPEIVCHELGHAVLDAVKPQLFDAALIEVDAFHEAFGDMSAILCALQLPRLRGPILDETKGRLNTSSRLSRLAEQLGWGIRQSRPDAVDVDCLRNASNRFFWRNPIELPPKAPATLLSSEAHSFSRVFTGAFLDALNRMLEAEGDATDANLLSVSRNMGRLLIDAVYAADIKDQYYSQVAATMIQADAFRFNGKYKAALTGAFVERGLLSIESAIGMPKAPALKALTFGAGRGMAPAEVGGPGHTASLLGFDAKSPDEGFRRGKGATPELPQTPLTVGGAVIHVRAPTGKPRLNVGPAMQMAAGVSAVPDQSAEPRSFLFGLIHRQQVDLTAAKILPELNAQDEIDATHRIENVDGKLVLKRNHFACGCRHRKQDCSQG
jgi:hypothetical protein